jgi:hypothetical protein
MLNSEVLFTQIIGALLIVCTTVSCAMDTTTIPTTDTALSVYLLYTQVSVTCQNIFV